MLLLFYPILSPIIYTMLCTSFTSIYLYMRFMEDGSLLADSGTL